MTITLTAHELKVLRLLLRLDLGAMGFDEAQQEALYSIQQKLRN